MTDDDRLDRIAEIFDILQAGDPQEAVDRRIDLCREALRLMTADEMITQTGGWLAFELGKAYVRRIGPDRFQDLTAAITSFTTALNAWTPESQPVNWVAAQANLGFAYSDRHAITGDRADELGSLSAYQAARRAVDRDSDPVTWAELANNIGVLQLQRTDGDRSAILEEALEYLQDAALIRAQLGLAGAWVQTQANLGAAYRDRVAGDRSDNLERSLACLEAALSAAGPDMDMPVLGAIHRERSETLRFRIAGNWADNIEQAYASAQEAVRLIQPTAGPLEWADAQRELANVLRRRTVGSLAENLEAAITSYRQALARYNRDTAPLKWALTSTELGRALTGRIRGQRVTNLEEAVECLEGAAATLSGSAGSMTSYAAVLSELGSAYLLRRRGSAADNAEAAWRHLGEARALMERLGMPPRTRAAVLNGLGTVGRNLGRLGVLGGDWHAAADGYQAALDAADARYRESLLLEARYDELTDMTGLRAELAVALARQVRGPAIAVSPDADALLRRAVTVVENGRMQMVGDLMERDRARLDRLQAEHLDLYQSYFSKAERLREYESKQWQEFQQL